MKWWPFMRRRARKIVAQTDALVQRVRDVEDEKRQSIDPEREDILRRLRLLEIQAEVLARRHALKFNHNGEPYE